MNRRFVIGDIHGRHKALVQVLERAKFDYENDKLICLGDVADGDMTVDKCFDELLKIKNLIYVLGNHDIWFMEWIKQDSIENTNQCWWNQGGIWTARSYGFKRDNVPESHRNLLLNAKLYHEEDGLLFVHGGFDDKLPIAGQNQELLTWDRDLIQTARSRPIRKYKHIFVGHTTTQFYKSERPCTFHNLTMVDTGAGWNGKLTVMDVYTAEYWQSDSQIPCRYDEEDYEASS